MATGFYHDEICLWHQGAGYAFLAPVGGHVEPLTAGGLPESPESKRRLVNLMRVTGLIERLVVETAPPADLPTLERIHPREYLDAFATMSEAGGGELGERTPFGPGGFGIARQATGLAIRALDDVLAGRVRNAYALTRPPGHHCTATRPMGFCLLANVAVAIEAAKATHDLGRVVVIDWDVHHGNGTEAIFYDRADVVTISIHQERNYPQDTGAVADRGSGAGEGANLNIPLPPGAGHDAYLDAFDRIIAPAVERARPDIIVVACGFDASAVDPLSRMMLHAGSFADLTRRTMNLADTLCEGRLVLCHEGGYSEVHVPFCGHATIETLAGSNETIADPLDRRIRGQQPGGRHAAFLRSVVDEVAEALA